MAIIKQETDRLDSMTAVDAFVKARREGYTITTRPKSNVDPKSLADVVCRDAEMHGTANINLGGKEFPVRFERYRSKNLKEPYLRIHFSDQAGRGKVILELSTQELRVSSEIDLQEEPLPTPDLPRGILKAPGADIVLVHRQDLKKTARAGRVVIRAQTFTLQRTGNSQEVTLLYRPVKDSFLFIDSSSREPTRVETVPQEPIKDLTQLSGKTVATIALDLDPYIAVGSLDFYKPVKVTPTHSLSREVAKIIVDNLYPPSTG